VLQPIIDNKAFAEVAKSKPDLSALRGIQLAVVVTGFETKEEKVTDENSIGRVQPHFAAIADTHAWNWQTKAFAENQLGEFINNVYGGGVSLDTAPKNGGTYYTWTAEDGRKAYAFVDGSLIFFGNDESSIDKCIAVKNGQADSILKNPKLPAADPNVLASGYVSTDGIAQIANIVGLAMAAQTGEAEQVKSFIAGVLPQILRSSISDVTWTATKTEQGIEDKYLISTAPDVSNVLSETMAPGESLDTSLADLLPADPPSVTLYNFKDPQVAWRSVLVLLQKQADPTAGKLLAAFSGMLFEPYGIRDPEAFLHSAGPAILTMKGDEAGEKVLVVAPVKDQASVEKSLTSDAAKMKTMPTSAAPESAAFTYAGKNICVGTASLVLACGKAINSPQPESAVKGLLGDTKASIVTLGIDGSTAADVSAALDAKKGENAASPTRFRTETRFTKNGI
ncbi:MAG: hypothetical protein ACREO5_08610, partial [Candidatus Binatia bacterium]